MKRLFFLVLILVCSANAGMADLFNMGGSYSKQYSNFGFNPYIQNRIPEQNHYTRRELGYMGNYKKENPVFTDMIRQQGNFSQEFTNPRMNMPPIPYNGQSRD